MRRMIFVFLLIIVAVVAAIGGVGYWFYNNYLYYQTDDAQISGHILNVTSPQAGQLKTLSVKLGDKVTTGEVLGTITAAPAAPGAKPTTIDVTSPINGTVVQANSVEGQTLAPGTSVAQVADLANLNVMAYIDEGKINDIKPNQDVDISVDAFSGTSYKGHVQNIVSATAGSFSLLPSSDNASGNFTKVAQRIPVVITLDGNGSNTIVPGMSAEVTIHIH
ncbi:multidrug efflux protein [Dictyobacter alpinus]|uniref:Multidrug efflux protein n=1 Tax=Dictyobacter alpinus TaxID=2014873 RepID=A0A402B4Q5_9CHLR|nr:efflux RND transporter periplasmic adaptor subunit [Dictyobacter alpinus]GCE26326.1 multidrug efflux protein [Dictyobacter alpinus]